MERIGIRYHIRIRNNFMVELPGKKKKIKVWHLFNAYKVNEFIYHPRIVRINGELCYLSGCKLNNKQGKQEFLIIVSFNKPEKALKNYKQRWQIEMCFKAMKSSRFDIENTHLQNIERIEKLALLIMIAFVWCYKVGVFLHQIRPIKIKKHRRLAKSIFKYGLDYIASVSLTPLNQNVNNIFQFLSCT